ncbi:MAG: alpha/beta hydrolase [Vicinamibacteria bacterium]
MFIPRAIARLGLVAALALGGSAHAADPLPGLTTQFVKVETGTTLQYVVQGDPKGPVIVLLHGAGDSWHSWELVLPHIPKTYRTYAVTLRGHGLSDHPASGYSRADFASDITSLLKMLDLHKVTLVGHSLGSFVAQVVAQNDVEGRLSNLVLVGSGPGRGRDPGSPVSSYFANVKDPIDYTFARDFQSGTAFTPLPPAFLEMMIAEVQRVPAAMFHELSKGAADPQHVEKLAKIKAKTLMLWGEKDVMFSKADQTGLLAAIPGSTLIAYPNTGHALHWEHPERFTKDLLAFMAK